EPEPPMNIALRRQRHSPVTIRKTQPTGMTLTRIRKPNQNVPRRSNNEEDENARKRKKLARSNHAAARAAASQQQMRQHNKDRKDNADQAFGKNVQRTASGKSPT